MTVSNDYRKKLTKSQIASYHAKEQAFRDFLEAFNTPDLNRNISEPKDFLDSIIKQLGIKEGVDKDTLIASWREIAGDFIATNAHPHSLNRGVLSLRVVQPSMRFHLEQAKPQLLKKLQESLGKKMIRQVKFNIG
ncbi:DUF721 domain-containing protein [Akkermansiaceae bacterium]|nr:DUF721 domain-containing protein [Akkermansiaceae bacterium]